jgi:alanine racemase
MDACMVDVTEVIDVKVGTLVEFFGENLPVNSVSDTLRTIPYEVLTSVSPRVKRVYYRE